MSAPHGVEREYPLARLTTVRTGGPADWFARPEREHELVDLLGWAAEERLAVGMVGSGSNLLVADDGFHGLAIKLAGALASIEHEGDRLLCGGGARLPSAAAKAAGWGLSGLEFGINIPGTAGGAVRMNANAYGGELAAVLEWVEISTALGTSRRLPNELGFVYRDSNLREAEVVSHASFKLTPADPDEIRATLATMRERRRDAQPSGIKTFGSTFKNPDRSSRRGPFGRPAARGRRLPRPADRRRPLRREARQLRREHRRRHDRRGPGADGRGAAPGPRGDRSGARARGPGAGRGQSPARQLGAVKRALAALVVVIVLAVAVYWFLLRSDSSPEAAPPAPPHAVARIGEGSKAVAVDQHGNVAPQLKLPKKPPLPLLPLKAPPKGGAVKGPVLKEVEVLAAAPPALTPYLASTSFDRKAGGVTVETTAGIELRFGDSSQAEKKWKDAAAILADPTITSLDYVDLEAPSRPSYKEGEHELPPAP